MPFFINFNLIINFGKMKYRCFLFMFTVLMFTSCEDENVQPLLSDEADIIEYSVLNYFSDVEINEETGLVLLKFPMEVTSVEGAVAEFTLSEGAQATIDGTLQVSGKTQNDFKGTLYYVVTAEDQINKKKWQIKGTNNAYSIDWGLGNFERKTLSLNRSYNWYIDQWNTGKYNFENCGPSSTTMAAKWSDESFTESTQDARNTYHSDGGWWNTTNISDYLSSFHIPHHYIALSSDAETSGNILKEELNAGNILILCTDMYYIRPSLSVFYRVDKFYRTASDGWGHFFIVKGYKIVDGHLFFETYDPYNSEKSYSDGTPMGKDRYYRVEDVYLATSNWWNYAISVSEKGTKNKSTIQGIKDISKVPVKWGGSGR